MEYQIKPEDLEKCFKFAVEYHLEAGKLTSNRTTGQYRGLGGIIDSFVIGKLIEIGVSKIIERGCKKICVLDFDIHALNKGNISDPDILKIKEDKLEREPNLYVEIKNISVDDRWIGLTAEQFNTILSNKLVKQSPKKVILIYATLITKNQSGNIDPLGVYLKSKLNVDILKKYCEIGELIVKIQYVLTGEELNKYGVAFNQGSYLYETEIIMEASQMTTKQILDKQIKFEKTNHNKGLLPIFMSNNFPEPKEFGKFEYSGDIEIYLKKNFKNGKMSSQRLYIHALTDSVIKNNVLGVFELKKDKIYNCRFETVGMNPSLKRNNIWIAQRNLKNFATLKSEQHMEEVRKNI